MLFRRSIVNTQYLDRYEVVYFVIHVFVWLSFPQRRQGKIQFKGGALAPFAHVESLIII